ncbi:DUF1284 domain-containing protein [Terriglobus tenax]|uniref:DUF1284 domain-containing protein n=1 Tax=Terriglobus tenax TaxID=1111115 RepID=UPI0021E0CB84|nr:DUF1284 domain-containing protein [Terriglobus tenax]
MIRLRPHHLLCMLTYKGEGYSQEFVKNFDRLTRQLAATGEPVEVVSGPDDVCAPLLESGECHCFSPSVVERDQKAAEELSALLGEVVAPGATLRLTPARLAMMKTAFRNGDIRSACVECPWKDLCDGIAARGFAGTRLPG